MRSQQCHFIVPCMRCVVLLQLLIRFFSLHPASNSLTMLCLCIVFFEFILVGDCGILQACKFMPFTKYRKFCKLRLQILFKYSFLPYSFLPFRGFNCTDVNILILYQRSLMLFLFIPHSFLFRLNKFYWYTCKFTDFFPSVIPLFCLAHSVNFMVRKF